MTDHTMRPKAFGVEDLAGFCLSGDTSVFRAHCHVSKRHYTELQGGAVYQYRDLSPDAVATAAN